MSEQRIAQLEAENAELREKLECAARQNALNMQAFKECLAERESAYKRYHWLRRQLWQALNECAKVDAEISREECVVDPRAGGQAVGCSVLQELQAMQQRLSE